MKKSQLFVIVPQILSKGILRAIKKGRESLKISLRRFQFDSAKKGKVAMQIWLGKQYLGQKDKHDITTDDQPNTEQAKAEKAIQQWMNETGGTRQVAIKYLAPLMPEVKGYIN
jgi:hypothetical protein